MSDAVSTPENRRTLARSVYNMVLNYGFDGLDIDWEFPITGGPPGSSKRPEDIDNLISFCEELRYLFDNTGYDKYYDIVLTIIGRQSYFTQFNWTRTNQVVDWVNIMTYNMIVGTSLTNHHAPLFPSIASSLNAFVTNTKMSPNYFSFGIATHGHSWQRVVPIPPNTNGFRQPSNQPASTWPYLTTIIKELTRGGTTAQRYWDDAAKMPWIFVPRPNNQSYFWSFDDYQSGFEKTRFAIDRGFGGTFTWHWGMDLPLSSNYSVLRGMIEEAQNSTNGRYNMNFAVPCVDSPTFCNAKCSAPPAYRTNRSEFAPIVKKCNRPGVFAFAFTDGPDRTHTPLLLDTLRSLSIKASFILTPQKMLGVREASLVFRAWQEGHYVTHAGFSMNSFWSMADDDIPADLKRGDDVLSQIIQKRPVSVAIPANHYDDRVINIMGKNGYVALTTNMDSQDWKTTGMAELEATDLILRSIREQLRNATRYGGPRNYSWILSQSTYIQASIQAIPAIVNLVRSFNYTVVNIQECTGSIYAGYRPSWDAFDLSMDRVPDFSKPWRHRCDAAPGQIVPAYHSFPSADAENLLDWLLEKNMKAVLFVVGSMLNENIYAKNWLLRAYREGHTIGHHSYGFKSYTDMSELDILADLRQNDLEIYQVTGYAPKLVLPPMNQYDARVKRIIEKYGYQLADPEVILNPKWSTVSLQSELINYFDSTDVSSFLVVAGSDAINQQEQQRFIDLVKNSGYQFGYSETCFLDPIGSVYRDLTVECGDLVCYGAAFNETVLTCPDDCTPTNMTLTQTVEIDQAVDNMKWLRENLIVYSLAALLLTILLISAAITAIRYRSWRQRRLLKRNYELKKLSQSRELLTSTSRSFNDLNSP